MVRFNFTMAQRAALFSGAAVVAWFLITQSEEAGLQGVAWLLGAVLVVGLAVLAFAPSTDTTDKKALGKPALAINRERLGPLLDQLTGDCVSFLERKLPHANVTPASVMESMKLCYREAGLKMAFMVLALVAAKRHRAFIGSGEQRYLEIIAAGRLTVLVEKDLSTSADVAAPRRRELALKAVTRDMASCLAAIGATMNNFVVTSKHPTDPVFALINHQVPLVSGAGTADERSAMYRSLFTSMCEIAEQRI